MSHWVVRISLSIKYSTTVAGQYERQGCERRQEDCELRPVTLVRSLSQVTGRPPVTGRVVICAVPRSGAFSTDLGGMAAPAWTRRPLAQLWPDPIDCSV